MKYAVLTVVGLLSGAAAGVGIGCEGSNKLDVVNEEGANAQHANLPSIPAIPPPPAPVTYPDGAFSVYGVRHVAARNWSKQVRVRGYITKVYTPFVPGTNPPRVCGERDRCLEEKPHVYIADTATEADPERLMMVTGYANYQSELDDARRAAASGHAPTAPGSPALATAGLTHAIPTDFNEGAQVTVTGTLARRAGNGEADSNGLVDYGSHVTNTPAPAPPPGHGHH
jgi:hypothetical protein